MALCDLEIGKYNRFLIVHRCQVNGISGITKFQEKNQMQELKLLLTIKMKT